MGVRGKAIVKEKFAEERRKLCLLKASHQSRLPLSRYTFDPKGTLTTTSQVRSKDLGSLFATACPVI